MPSMMNKGTPPTMKNIIKLLAVIATAGFLAGCGNSSDSSAGQPVDPATQPEVQAELFERTVMRVKALIEAKDFGAAQRTLDGTKQNYKLTAEQEKVIEQLRAQIPKS